MLPNFLWGITLIMVGSSIILNKLYGIAIPFELIMGAVLVLLGVSMLINMKR